MLGQRRFIGRALLGEDLLVPARLCQRFLMRGLRLFVRPLIGGLLLAHRRDLERLLRGRRKLRRIRLAQRLRLRVGGTRPQRVGNCIWAGVARRIGRDQRQPSRRGPDGQGVGRATRAPGAPWPPSGPSSSSWFLRVRGFSVIFRGFF